MSYYLDCRLQIADCSICNLQSTICNYVRMGVRVARAAFSLAGSHQDSNLAPTRLQRVALPNELCVRPCGWGTPHPLEPLAGLEPAATCLQDRCTSACA